MAKFKLIKKFPSSPEVGTIFTGGEGFCYKERGMDGKKPFSSSLMTYLEKDVENNPEYFAPCLFTTEDGVDVYKGDRYFFLSIANEILQVIACGNSDDFSNDIKRFSTYGAAKAYLDSLKPKYKEGDYVVLSTGSSKYMGVYSKTSESTESVACTEWVGFQSGKFIGGVNTSEGHFIEVERLMTQHEIFEYFMVKHDVRSKWPIGSEVELVNDGLTLNLRGSRGVVKGYTVEKEHLHLYIEWTNSIYDEDIHIVDEENGIYPIEIFKPIK